MTTALHQVVRDALGRLAQQKPAPDNASVLVQFAAGDWSAIKVALDAEDTDFDTTARIVDLTNQLHDAQAALATAQQELVAFKAALPVENEHSIDEKLF